MPHANWKAPLFLTGINERLLMNKQGQTEIEYGAEVIDRNGKILGTVGHIVRNTWTGQISKFIVRGVTPGVDLFLSPEDVLEITKSTVKLNISFDELSKR